MHFKWALLLKNDMLLTLFCLVMEVEMGLSVGRGGGGDRGEYLGSISTDPIMGRPHKRSPLS